MPLKVSSNKNRPGVFTISPIGSIDARTHSMLEEEVESVLIEKPNVIIFDMEFLDYINSMGVRILLKTKKEMQKNDGKVAVSPGFPLSRVCHNKRNKDSACNVIPGLTRNPDVFKALLYWMPDRVRHDVKKKCAFYNCDTVSKAGIQYPESSIQYQSLLA